MIGIQHFSWMRCACTAPPVDGVTNTGDSERSSFSICYRSLMDMIERNEKCSGQPTKHGTDFTPIFDLIV